LRRSFSLIGAVSIHRAGSAHNGNDYAREGETASPDRDEIPLTTSTHKDPCSTSFLRDPQAMSRITRIRRRLLT
jgi:hypothetical protein